MKNPSKVTLFLVAIIVFVLGAFVGFAGLTFYQKITLESDKIVSGDLSIHFLELGNKFTGDSVYIKAGDVDILIDAGSKNDSATTINNYLKNYVEDNVLEYVIATHAHEDHLAGFYSTTNVKGVFEEFEVETIIDFPKTNKDNPTSTSVLGRYISARDNEISKGATYYTALQCFNETDGAKRIFELTDGIQMEILYNYYYDHSQSAGENDYSVCLMINQDDNHFLFTGDLEAQGERKLVNFYQENYGGLPHCVLYKAGHHGSKTSSTQELLSAITPEYVCVCCCCGTSEYTDENDNQFVTKTFIENVAPYTDKVYVTTMVDNYVDKSNWTNNGTVKSMNGNIVVTANKSGIKINCSNNNTILKDTDWFRANRECPEAWL